MAQAWPTGFPASFLYDGSSERWAENIVRSSMEVGPAKVRRRSTAGVRRITLEQNLTKTQVATMQTYYETTCAHGSLSATIADPRTGSNIEVRFVTPPTIAVIGYEIYRIRYDFEVLP
jgi:hypothetical protein